MFSWSNYWDLPCVLIEQIAAALCEKQQQQANEASITTAYLIDTVNVLARAVWGGKDAAPYEAKPSQYWPYPPPDPQAEKDLEIMMPDPDTIAEFLAELDAGRVPPWVFAHHQPLIPHWRKNV
jgi:hypothetical protein